jgi:hypothetical protein
MSSQLRNRITTGKHEHRTAIAKRDRPALRNDLTLTSASARIDVDQPERIKDHTLIGTRHGDT